MLHTPFRLLSLIVVLLVVNPAGIFAQREGAPSPPGAISYLNTRPNFYDTKLTEAQKALLSPLPADQAAFVDFLRQENAGLFRIHPKGKYEPGMIISAKEAERDLILPILGGGAYYSFKEKTNKLGPWSELALEGNRLTAGVTRQSIGILTELGDIPLAEVTLTTPGVRYLAILTAPRPYEEITGLVKKSRGGFEVDGFRYASALDATTETTYALRAILYKRDGYIVYPNEPYHRLRQYSIGYDGSDTLLVFRIVRRHEDGSVTIVWKRLQKYRATKMKKAEQRFTQKKVQQLFARELQKGMSLEQVLAFLNVNAIEHSEYVAGEEGENAPPGAEGFLYATVPDIDPTPFRTHKLDIRFSFNGKQELLDYTVKKNQQ